MNNVSTCRQMKCFTGLLCLFTVAKIIGVERRDLVCKISILWSQFNILIRIIHWRVSANKNSSECVCWDPQVREIKCLITNNDAGKLHKQMREAKRAFEVLFSDYILTHYVCQQSTDQTWNISNPNPGWGQVIMWNVLEKRDLALNSGCYVKVFSRWN